MLPEFYELEGHEEYTRLHTGLKELGPAQKMFFNLIPVKAGRLLDVGCGDGIFLTEARNMGYEVWGIDFDSKSIEVCKQRGLKNIFNMSSYEFVEFCEREGLKFDVITFFEVLEHQDRPREFLESIKKMIKEHGFIAGSVPNRDRIEYRRNRPVDFANYPPNHFLRFTIKTLRGFLKHMGFKEVLVKSTTTLSEYVSLIQQYVTGSKINEYFRAEYGDSNTQYKPAPLKSGISKTLKAVRFALLLPVALCASIITPYGNLYFHAKYR